MVQQVDRPGGASVPLVGPVAKLSETPARICLAPPRLGEHTDSLLRTELGYTEVDLVRLESEGVI